MNWFDFLFFGVMVAIYVMRKSREKSISMIVSIIYCSIMCCATMFDEKYLFTGLYVIIGLISIVLFYRVNKDVSKEYNKKKSKLSTILLSYFFGTFGIHRFYLNQKTLGCLYLLFWWTTIPLFVSMAEAIIFLIMPKQRFNEKYNNESAENVSVDSQQEILPNFKNGPANVSNNTRFDDKEYDNQRTQKNYSNILLPIGMCSVSGEEGNFEISIVSEGKTYKFGVKGDGITTYWKDGMKNAQRYGG